MAAGTPLTDAERGPWLERVRARGSATSSKARDAQPNVRRDGLEIFFFSTRPDPDAPGAADLSAATRNHARDAWSTPQNFGPNVNSAAAETRPSISWDGTTLYFGSTRTGSESGGDIRDHAQSLEIEACRLHRRGWVGQPLFIRRCE